MINSLTTRLKSGEIVLGAWVNSTDPLITEIYATFGCDWIFIDTEHEPIGRRDLMGLLMAVKGTACSAIVRVPENAPEQMKWVMDLGAGGIIVPRLSGPDDVMKAVRNTRYHPIGERGCGPMRAWSYGKDVDYLERANDELLVMLQAEERGFVENLDAILEIEGYDAIFVGPMDLAQSMGYLGHPEHPEVQEAVERVIRRASAAGKTVAVIALSPEDLVRQLDQGAKMFILGTDYRFVRDGIKEKFAVAKECLKNRNQAGYYDRS